MTPAPRPPPRRGFFVTLEGPEGSGKSSQARALARRLQRAGHRVTLVRDPGSTPLGRELRRALLHTDEVLSPLQEALLFIGGRVALVEERIAPALRRGRVVVCDRFHDSTVAYQGFGGGVDVALLERIGRRAIRGVVPSLTLLLDVDTRRGLARLHRSRDRMERKTLAFHRRVRSGFLTLARRQPHRFTVIDASRSSEIVQGQIRHVVFHRLHGGTEARRHGGTR
jgi:dTMP kinase